MLPIDQVRGRPNPDRWIQLWESPGDTIKSSFRREVRIKADWSEFKRRWGKRSVDTFKGQTNRAITEGSYRVKSGCFYFILFEKILVK